MVDYPVFFPLMSTLTWDTFLTLRGTWGSHYHSGLLNVPFIMFFLNMVNYPVFFLLMSTLTWDTFLTLRGT